MSTINDLIKYKKDKKICIYDFETCNLNLGPFDKANPSGTCNFPWQATLLYIENDTIKETHDLFTKWPNAKISPDAARATQFYSMPIARYGNRTMSQILEQEGKPEEKNFEIIKKVFDKSDYLAGQNILGFDIFLWKAWCELHDVDYLPYAKKSIDTLAISRGIELEYPWNKNNEKSFYLYQLKVLNEGRKKLRKLSLGALGKRYKIEHDYESLHDGLSDCQLCLKVLNKLLWEIKL